MNYCHVCANLMKPRFLEVTDPLTKEKFVILSCGVCGLAETNPQPVNLGGYYAQYHGGRHGFTNDYCAWRRVRWLEKNFVARKETNCVLDVGCGDGTFMKAAQKRGWKTVGTELNVERFSDSSFSVFVDLAQIKENYGVESFDAITLWHTLEHFRNPREILSDAFELLAPGGVMLIAVPDAYGLQARTFGKYWLHLDVPRHLFHFGFHSLKSLLARTGFDVLNHWHQEFEYDLLGWSQSALNAIFKEPNVFMQFLSGHKTKVNSLTSAANLVLGVGFSALAIPFVLFGTLAQKGGTIIVCAGRKHDSV